MSYWVNRLRYNEAAVIISNGVLRRNLGNLKKNFDENKFDGRDTTTIITFLTGFSDSCDELKLSEREAYLALLSFSTGSAYMY